MHTLKSLALIGSLIGSLFCVGCATSANLERKMQERVGQKIDTVIDELGPPTSTFVAPSGYTHYTWAKTGHTTGTVQGTGYGTARVNLKQKYCNLTYKANGNNTVVATSFEGNNCKL